jgi:hypothetical protein
VSDLTRAVFEKSFGGRLSLVSAVVGVPDALGSVGVMGLLLACHAVALREGG